MQTSDPRFRAVVLMLSLTVAGGCRLTLKEPRPPGGPGSIPGPPSREQRIAAVLSIYSQARQAVDGPDDAGSAFKPMPAVEAAYVLRATQGPVGRNRRRRAIAKLAAADLQRPEFRDAIAVLLGGEDPDNPYSQPHLMMLTLALVLNLHVDLDLFRREALISDLLQILFGKFRDDYTHRNLTTIRQCAPTKPNFKLCPWPVKACDPCAPNFSYDPTDPCDPCNRFPSVSAYPTTATTTVEVIRPAAELATAFDGQRWDECGDFFSSTYAAQSTLPATPVTSPPAPGTTWSGHLYEEFEMTTLSVQVMQFKNLLTVDSTRTLGPSTYRFGYDLHDWISSTYLGVPTLDRIQKDCGYLSASEGALWTQIENKKTIAFTNPLLNGPTCDLLSAMGDAVVDLASCPSP